MKKKHGFIILILFVIFVIIKTSVDITKANKERSRLREEYPKIMRSDSIDNVVIDKYYPEKWRGGSFLQYITLDDNRKFYFKIDESIPEGSYCFGDIVSPGDRILKHRGSDTLFLYSDDFEYLFLLRINEEEK